ncbi:hypothetical protein JCM5353_004820 [Sporobolomyces roseus]
MEPSTRSLNFRSPSPLTPPLLLIVGPATIIALLVWPLLVLGSFIPVIGLVCLTSLLSCTAFIYLILPTTLHLLLSQDHLPSSRSFLPFALPHIPLFTPSILTPIHLTHSALRILYDGYRSSLISLFFDSISKRILILGGSDSSKILKENIIYLPSSDPRHQASKRLDVYYPELYSASAVALAPVVVLLPSPSFRFMSSKAFPSAQIALRLRRLGYCVVVPSISSFPETTLETMVYETRECLRWIKDEIAEFGGDRKRVWVLGHGAGAHVGLLSVVQSAVVCLREKELAEREERNERRRKREAEVGRDSLDGRETQGEKKSHFSLDPFLDPDPRHSSRPIAFDAPHTRHAEYSSSSASSSTSADSSDEDEFDRASISSAATLPFPAGVHACRTFAGPEEDIRDQPETMGETLSSWEGLRIRGMILVGGVYDTVKQIKKEKEMGMSQVSALQRVCGPTKSDAELASPCHLLYASSSLLTAFPSSLPEKFLLIHGGADQIVPYSQSVLLKNLLVGVGLQQVRLRLYREETGLGSLASLMHQTRYSPLILDEIERIISSDLQEDDQAEDGGISQKYSSKSGTKTKKRERQGGREKEKQ